MTIPHRPARRTAGGFTLVEMLVVIGIIGVLAALLIPVIQGAVSNAQATSNGYEISQLIMSISRYQSENGGQYPPSFGEGNTATYYKDAYNGGTGPYRNTMLYRYISVAYPRASDIDIRYMFEEVADRMDQASALVFWLSQTSNDARQPFTNRANQRKYYDFDEKRKTTLVTIPTPTTAALSTVPALDLYGYRPRYAKESFFTYLEAKHYPAYVKDELNLNQGTTSTAKSGGATFRPYLKKDIAADGNGKYLRTNLSYYQNPESYQLVCAGLDGRFQANVEWMRKFPCGPVGTKVDNTAVNFTDFADDGDNQANFSEGRRIEDVQP